MLPVSSQPEVVALPMQSQNLANPAATATATSRTWILFAIALLLLGAGAFALAREHSLPSIPALRNSLRSVSIAQLALGVLAINVGLIIRGYRWVLLMPRERRPSGSLLIAPQFVGFAAVSLFGRVADLTRPYLVAKRTGTPLAMQIAVYSVERGLDLAATAVLFSVTLLFVPRTAPHHKAFSRAGILASLATLCLLAFAVVLRRWGKPLADLVRRRLGALNPRLGISLAGRVLEMQTGFSAVRSGELAIAFAWSLVIWFGIALAYMFSAHSLPTSPQLEQLGMAGIMLLMATSMGASLLQLPIVGWFTQIAALAAAYHGFFGVPAAPASLCGLLTFAVNTFSVVPPGLILARWSGLSLHEGRGTAVPEAA